MSNKITVRVYHNGYGCDTGWCGHSVELTLPDGKEKNRFEFDHPPYIDYSTPYPYKRIEDHKVWATKLAQETVKSLWPDHYDSCDWDNIDIEDVSED